MAIEITKGNRKLQQLPLTTVTFDDTSFIHMHNTSGDRVSISYDDFIDALITAGVGGGGWTDTTVTDADFTAADDTRYYLPASVLTANRVVDVSGITTKVAFVVAEDAFRFRLTFTGATVYDYGGAETTDGVMGRGTSVYEIIDGNLIRTQ